MRWRGWLFDNLGLKIFALLLASLLYLHVLTDRTTEEVVYFPLEVANLADTLALATDPPAEVGVRLRGTGKQLIRLRYARPTLKLNLGGVAAGLYQRSFGPADVPLEGTVDVSVLEVVDPPDVKLEVARRSVRQVVVVPNLVGHPARGFVLAGPAVARPSQVRLSGPAAWVARQDTLHTESVNIAGKRDTVENVVPLTPPPDWAHASPGSVLVEVPIDAEAVKTLTLGVEVRAIRGLLRVEVRPASVTATWRGPRSRAAAIDARRFRAYVDADRRGRGEWSLPVRLEGPGAGDLVLEPDSVGVVLH